MAISFLAFSFLTFQTLSAVDTLFPFKLDLDTEKELSLRWRIEYARNTIYFLLSGRIERQQWLTFGFSDYGETKNADLTFTNIQKGLFLQDWQTDDNGVLHIDHQQDYIVTYQTWWDGYLTLEFHRKFDTCDGDDYVIDRGTCHILFGVWDRFPYYGESLMSSNQALGLLRVQLLKPNLQTPPLPPDVWSFEVTNPSITIPTKETTYWWYMTKLPHLEGKHHIIKYEGIIQPGNEEYVHHIEVFHCEVGPGDRVSSYNGPGMAEGKPPELSACREVIGAWAMGATAMYLPEEAGTAIGGPQTSRYILLEVHFNNPSLKKDIIDSSGIRFYVTRHLRKYDSGIMELGLEYTNKMAIPPHQHLFCLTGYCIPECTKIGIPAEGIRVYASQLHTHLTGKRVYTKHIRDGKELPELNRDNHYSPHLQEIRALPRPVLVKAGDALITTCEDSTVNRTSVTLGGYSIREEMCVNYVHYYPRCQLEVCKSSVSDKMLYQFFHVVLRNLDYLRLDIYAPFKEEEHMTPIDFQIKRHRRRKDIKSGYEAIRWSQSAVKLLKTLYQISPISMQCNKSDGSRFHGVWDNMPIPHILRPLRKRHNECQRDIFNS